MGSAKVHVYYGQVVRVILKIKDIMFQKPVLQLEDSLTCKEILEAENLSLQAGSCFYKKCLICGTEVVGINRLKPEKGVRRRVILDRFALIAIKEAWDERAQQHE